MRSLESGSKEAAFGNGLACMKLKMREQLKLSDGTACNFVGDRSECLVVAIPSPLHEMKKDKATIVLRRKS